MPAIATSLACLGELIRRMDVDLDWQSSIVGSLLPA